MRAAPEATCYKPPIDTSRSTPISRLLPGWFRRQGWFVRPSGALLGAEVTRLDPIDGGPEWMGLSWLDANVWFAGGRAETYRLLVAICPSSKLPGRRIDLSGLPDGIIGTIKGTGDPQDETAEAEELLVAEALSLTETASAAVRALFPAAEFPMIRFATAEPDNQGGPAAAALLDTGHVVKLMRRVDGETNPDIEVVSALAGTNFDTAATPLATIGGTGATETGTGGGPVIGYVRRTPRVVETGVGTYVRALSELFTRRCQPAELRHSAVRPMSEIGGTIGRLHVALAEVFGVLVDQGSAWSESMLASLDRKATDGLDVDRLRVVVHRLDTASDLGASIRIHHNLHMGNVVFDGRRWHVVNFEGDGRPFREVRQRSSPLQDLSRAISSIELTGASVLAQFLEGSEERDRELGVLIEALEQRVIDALIDGYSAVPGVEALLPSSSDSRDALLAVFETHHRIEESIPEPDDAPWERFAPAE